MSSDDDVNDSWFHTLWNILREFRRLGYGDVIVDLEDPRHDEYVSDFPDRPLGSPHIDVEAGHSSTVPRGFTEPHRESVRQRLGVALDAVDDDENPNWEEDSDIGDVELEELLRFAGEASGPKKAPERPSKDRDQDLKEAAIIGYHKVQYKVYKTWQLHWKTVIYKMHKKCRSGAPPKALSAEKKFFFPRLLCPQRWHWGSRVVSAPG